MNRFKKLFPMVVALGIVGGFTQVRAEELTLKRDTTEIVVAIDAPKSVRFAAGELAELLGGCLGGRIPVVTAPSGKTEIFLGDSVWAREQGIRVEALPRDGFAISVDARGVFIAGRDDAKADPLDAIKNGGVWSQLYERATLFGVYEFLERYAGVRMYFPGELGTILPKSETLVIPFGLISEAPVFTDARRYSCYWDGAYPKSLLLFKDAKSRYAERTLQNYRNRCETKHIPCCHGSNHFRYLERFGKTHPEYFALTDVKSGERSLPGGRHGVWHKGQLCWSSAITEEMYQDVKAYLTGRPAEERGVIAYRKKTAEEGCAWNANCMDRYVDVMPQDGYDGCLCPQCQAQYDKDSVHFATDFIWDKTVSMANRLLAEGVDGYLVMMAYHPYRNVPKVDIPTNVLVQVAVRGPWTQDSKSSISEQDEEIRAWTRKLGHKVWLWNYVNKGSALTLPNVPQIAPHSWGRYYSERAQMISGAFAESESDRWIYNYLNYYIFGKVAWKGAIDYEKLIDEHHALMFGVAKAEMKEFFDILERKWTKEIASRTIETILGPVGAPPSQYDIWTSVYSPAVLKRLGELLDAAASKVASGSLEARRIELMRGEIYQNLVAESRRYLDRIDPRLEDAWRDAHRTFGNLVFFGDFTFPEKIRGRTFGTGDGGKFRGWYGSMTPGETTVDRDVYRSAPASMRVTQTANDPKKVAGLTQYLTAAERPLKPGVRYRLSYFLKLENVTPLTRGGGVCARIWDDKNVWFPGGGESNYSGTTDWIAQHYEFTAGEKTNIGQKSYLSVEIRNATGTFWIDDVRLEALSPERRLRFGVITDTHVGTTEKTFGKLRKALELFKEKECELVVNCGDIADHHYPDGYVLYRKVWDEVFADVPHERRPQTIFAYAWHDAFEWNGASRDETVPNSTKAYADVKRLLGAANDPLDEKAVNGYTFLVIPQFVAFPGYLTTEELDRRVAAAVKGSGDKPVFVVDHIPPHGTTFGSWMWDAGRREVLKKYPTVIHLSGHIHGDISRDVYFWQGEFTAINAGDLFPSGDSYAALTVDVSDDAVDVRRWDIRDKKAIRSKVDWKVALPYHPRDGRWNGKRMGDLVWDSGERTSRHAVGRGRPATLDLPEDVIEPRAGAVYYVAAEIAAKTEQTDKGILTFRLMRDSGEKASRSTNSRVGEQGPMQHVFAVEFTPKNAAEKAKFHLEFSGEVEASVEVGRIRIYRWRRGAVPVTLTFDDGYKGQIKYAAPLLEKRGWKGLFSVITSRRGGRHSMTQDDWKALADRGHVIGSHSVTHPRLVTLLKNGEIEKVRHEIADSKAAIEQTTGRSCEWFCAPYVQQNDELEREVRAAGMKLMKLPRVFFGGDLPADGNYRLQIERAARANPEGFDICVHAVENDGSCWHPFTEKGFDEFLSLLEKMEKAGVIKVMPYAEVAK